MTPARRPVRPAPADPNEPRRYVSVKTAAGLFDTDERTIRRRIADGTLRAYRIGGRNSIRIAIEDLNAFATPGAGRDGAA